MTDTRVSTGSYNITPGRPDHVGYPHSGTHTWGAFAGLAIELGGYGDIELVDPYSGSRFWFRPDDQSADVTDWMIWALQAARIAEWPPRN